MSLWLSDFIRYLHTWPLLIYAATWVTLLTLTVAVASFSPEVAFIAAISPSSSFSQRCKTKSDGTFIRVPLDLPRDVICVSPHLFTNSYFDLIVPPIFAALIVAASAFVVQAMGLWEHDQTT
ncbi:hypothetical protein TanjilG_02366 [Lupinus angustifolius]|uniref:Uncharacterized protein n=1 Tax=Lupinus angustifolius TaxID=3871 RepID=A0A1J7HKB4_LUPAN|nr:PREDICTED: uncharacterized protein LOC109344662 [Lupinus angustifolius]OIW13232.1 hypothetical protein TanjilG_02366 [Lupinus angustifolius]